MAEKKPKLPTRGSASKRDRSEPESIVVEGREISISNPGKILFPKPKYTKLDLARYYLAVAEGALRGAGGRPNVLVRYPNGIGGEFFYQKRAPDNASALDRSGDPALPLGPKRGGGRSARRGGARVARRTWPASSCTPIPFAPRTSIIPDELRVDLDPVPGVDGRRSDEVAGWSQATLTDFGLTGWPKTSGGRGMHVLVRIEPRWTFGEVRRAALALAREVERRAPKLATSKWWKEERHGVFVDYNQNAKDRTVASAYSVRPTPDARVSAPLDWDEVATVNPADFTLATMPGRFAEVGDRHEGIDETTGSLESLLELSARHEAEGQGDAPWPPHYRKQPGEPARVQPSAPRAREEASADRDRPRQAKEDALAGLERWKTRHPKRRRTSSPPTCWSTDARTIQSTWTRIRVNLQHVPAKLRPVRSRLDPGREDPARARRGS